MFLSLSMENIFLISEKPFECTPEDARAIIISPFFTLFLFGIFDFSVIPTENPAISYSSSPIIPGCSAVSPPIRAHPA
jgi:hypothetical protein